MRPKTKNDIEQLKISGSILVNVLKELKKISIPGTKINILEKKAKALIRKSGAMPAFLGYKSRPDSNGYPAAICASLNEEIVHTIPDKRTLKSGDVLKIDVGINYKGFITDAAISIGIGKITPEAEKLIEATKAALEEAIKICKPGKTTGDIGWIINQTVENYGFKIVEKLTGHGVGFDLHEPPSVYNYGEQGEGVKLKSGMVLALEPMVSAGSGEIKEKPNGSFITRDKTLSAHFEKTIAITSNKPLILTPW